MDEGAAALLNGNKDWPVRILLVQLLKPVGNCIRVMFESLDLSIVVINDTSIMLTVSPIDSNNDWGMIRGGRRKLMTHVIPFDKVIKARRL